MHKSLRQLFTGAQLPKHSDSAFRYSSLNTLKYIKFSVHRRAAASAMSDDDPLVQYVALRSDLWREHQWPLGSIVAQGCHAATAALWISKESPETAEYCSPGNINHMRKV